MANMEYKMKCPICPYECANEHYDVANVRVMVHAHHEHQKQIIPLDGAAMLDW